MSSSEKEELVVVLDAPELGLARPAGVLTRWRGPRQAISFTYARSWLPDPGAFALDPRLPLIEGEQFAPSGELPGVFDDTAPDLWGKRLLERREAALARQAGRRPVTLTAWEFVTRVSDETRMGALRYRTPDGLRFVDDGQPAVPPLTRLRSLERAARRLEEHPEAAVDDPQIAILITPGSSLGGGRPKANYRALDNELWIAKFPSRDDRRDTGAWERLYSELAARAGIVVPVTDSLSFSSRGHTFVSRRFDRTAEARRLYASAMTMAGKRDGEDASYLDLVRAIRQNVAKDVIATDLEQMFRRLVFNILAGNRDDHLRNHGFIRAPEGWRLAPAFDMNPAREMSEHSLAIDGYVHAAEITAATATHEAYGLTAQRAEEIVEEVLVALAPWRDAAELMGVTEAEMDIVGPVIRTAR